ncbi:MAG TPA: bifunctional serine/threonine-protein kinase/formylglycine-generating enzyme family protein [Bdellovibrionota bacterium]|nr:bifunctional serine/threonine-protein kinase/formylglycine-generating enzyme family protein [Bdellovibrionota bacterium]
MPYRYPVKFGKYLLTRRIAVGGMAEVFKGKLVGIKGFEKTVAVKRILPEFNEDEEFVQMFVDEARISSNLHHANIIQVFDFGEIDDSYYMAMEFIDGPNLKNLLQRTLKDKGRLPRELAVYIVMQIARALDYAHQVRIDGNEVLNLVHRDVSPQNILVSRSGEVKITDFGIAKSAIKLSRTQPGKIQGKFSYMSPEQAAGQPLNHRSDIFSLGIIAFELLAGIKLYALEDTVKRYRQVREARVPRLGTLVPSLPAQLESLVMQMLSKDPSDRPQTCGEVIEQLSEFLNGKSSEQLAVELGQMIQDLFPPEKSDSGVGRRVEAMLSGGELPGEPGTAVRDDRIKGLEMDRGWSTAVPRSEVTQPARSTGFSSMRTITFAVVMPILAAAAYAFYLDRKEQRVKEVTRVEEAIPTTTATAESSSTPPPPTLSASTPTSFQKTDVALDKRKQREVDTRLQQLEDEVVEAKKEAAVAEQKLAKVEKGLDRVAAPKPPCPEDMVLISAGTFLFGSDATDQDRNHLVEPEASAIPIQRFCVDKYEFPNRKSAPPKTTVKWAEAQALCTKEGKRLCTQEEWERSCKGPNTSKRLNHKYPYGNLWDPNKCNTETSTELTTDEEGKAAPSGKFSACMSAEQVFDLSGNVDEWTASRGRFNNDSRVSRGGSSKRPGWASRCTSIRELRETTAEPDVGFRCCKDAS